MTEDNEQQRTPTVYHLQLSIDQVAAIIDCIDVAEHESYPGMSGERVRLIEELAEALKGLASEHLKGKLERDWSGEFADGEDDG